MTDGSDVLFFGNTADKQAELTAALGQPCAVRLPGGGRHAGLPGRPVRADPSAEDDARRAGQQRPVPGSGTCGVFSKEPGFPPHQRRHRGAGSLGHAAFVVPIAFALYRVGGAPATLAADPARVRLMVSATRQAFAALRAPRRRRDPRGPAHPLSPPGETGHPLLAPCARRSPRRAVVRRAQPGRPEEMQELAPAASQRGLRAHREHHARPRPPPGMTSESGSPRSRSEAVAGRRRPGPSDPSLAR